MIVKLTKEEIADILALHRKWLRGEVGGQRADLGGADLGGADLRDAYLRSAILGGAYLRSAYLLGAILGGAYLRNADLRGADLRDADLRGADLRGADLLGANLGGADLGGAYLRGADLRDADLRGADLRNADLRGANLGDADLGGAILGGRAIVPEEGEFIAYKKVRTIDGQPVILRLLIPEYAARVSSLVGRKCRASHAVVLTASVGAAEYRSGYDYNFVYRIGQEVKADDFDPDNRVECARGIHLFVTKKEAEEYSL